MDKTLTDALKHLPIPTFLPGEISWMVQVAVALFLTLILSIVLFRLLKRVIRSRTGLSVALLTALLVPLTVFIWVGGIGVVLDVINAQYHISIIKTLLALRPTIHILIICWFLLRLNDQLPMALLSRAKPPALSTIDLIKKIATIVILAIGLLLILPTFGVSVGGILAFGGVGGILIGFAAKDMLSNFFGAIMIHLDRPFGLGDWVSIPEKNMEGTVEYIGWRQVVIRTFDKRQLFVPNAMFGTLILVNPSRMTHRRIYETIGIRFNDIDKLPAILNDIRSYLEKNNELDKDLATVVNMNKFSTYSVDFVVSAYSKKTAWADFMPVKEAILLEIHRIITQHGACIALPAQVVHTY